MTVRLIFIAAFLCCYSGVAQAKDRPNVLFISVDDLNDWIGCMKGHPQALTPNIDRLATRGILFANAHCTAPACNPSRAAVFTGRLPHTTGVWSNRSESLGKLYPQGKVIPEVFRQAGYRTLGTGKLLHKGSSKYFDKYFSTGQRWSPFTGKKDVEYTEEELPTKATNAPVHRASLSDGREIMLPLNGMPSDRRPTTKGGESFDWGPIDAPDYAYGDTRIADWAIERLGEKSQEPLFLAVGFYRPHQPLWAPKRFFERFKSAPASLPATRVDDLDDMSSVGKKWAIEAITSGLHSTVVKHDQWRAAVEAYLACISYVDYEVGRLLDALDQSQYGDNTVVVLWSDHGWHLGEKQHWGKWTGWERATKVPLIIAPAKNQHSRFTARGKRCDRPVGLIDLFPTLLDLCAIKEKPSLDGVSLQPLLLEPTAVTNRTVATMFDPNNVSLRTDDLRYIRYADGSEELYDHKSDPHEWTNLIDSPGWDEAKLRLSEESQRYVGVGGP